MTILRKLSIIGLCTGLIAGVTTAVTSGAAAQGWEPIKPIQIVVISAKGGGADDMARLIQGAVAKHKLSSKPITVLNKSGGTGAEALLYLKEKQGDSHTLLVAQNKFYTTPLNNPGLGVDISTFTPIGRMAVDTFVLWVHKDSGIKTLDDFVKAAKAAGPKWIMAGSGKQSEDELLTEFLNEVCPVPGRWRCRCITGRQELQLDGEQPWGADRLLSGRQDGTDHHLHQGAPTIVPGYPDHRGDRERVRIQNATQRHRCSRNAQGGCAVLSEPHGPGLHDPRVAGVHEEEGHDGGIFDRRPPHGFLAR